DRRPQRLAADRLHALAIVPPLHEAGDDEGGTDGEDGQQADDDVEAVEHGVSQSPSNAAECWRSATASDSLTLQFPTCLRLATGGLPAAARSAPHPAAAAPPRGRPARDTGRATPAPPASAAPPRSAAIRSAPGSAFRTRGSRRPRPRSRRR